MENCINKLLTRNEKEEEELNFYLKNRRIITFFIKLKSFNLFK